MVINEKLKISQSSIRDVKVGKNVHVIEPCNLYECEIDDYVFIGPFCEIQKDVKIGKGTRIQSHSFICSLVEIGENCFIGHGVMFVNDKFQDGKPAQNDSSKWERTNIENNVYIGSNVTILPVNIAEGVVVGAGSVVTKDLLKPGKYAGNPASLLKGSHEHSI